VPLPQYKPSPPPALPSPEELLARYAKAAGEARPVKLVGKIASNQETGAYRLTLRRPEPRNVTVTGIERVGDREAYVARDGATTYYFDTKTSLLLRRTKTVESLLGPLPEQTDYEDYRAVDGMQVPFVIHAYTAAPWSNATMTFTGLRTSSAASAGRRSRLPSAYR